MTVERLKAEIGNFSVNKGILEEKLNNPLPGDTDKVLTATF
jgi:hypothetical protein